MPRSTSVSEEESQRLKRRFSKCEACRRDRKKCKPYEREWSYRTEEKCIRCEEKGYACGPNVSSRQPQGRVVSPAVISEDLERNILKPLQPSPGGKTEVLQEDLAGLSSACFTDSPETAQRDFSHSFKPSVEIRIKELESIRDVYLLYQRRRQACSSIDQKLGISNQDVVGSSLCALEQKSLSQASAALAEMSFRIEEYFVHAAKKTIKHIRRGPQDPKKGQLFHILVIVGDMFDLQLSFSGYSSDGDVDAEQFSSLQDSILDELDITRMAEGNFSPIVYSRGIRSTLSFTVHSQRCTPVSTFEIEQSKRDAQNGLNVYREVMQQVNPKYRKMLIGFPPLQYLLLTRRRDVAKAVILQNSSALGEKDALGRTIVHLLAELNDVELLNITMPKCGRLINEQDKFGMTPLAIATYLGHEEAFKFLLDHDADEWVQDRSARRLICTASAAGHISLVSQLLDRSHLSCSTDDVERVPLTEAVRRRRLSIVNILIDKGRANPFWGFSPSGDGVQRRLSQIAKVDGQEEMAEILMKAESVWAGLTLNWQTMMIEQSDDVDRETFARALQDHGMPSFTSFSPTIAAPLWPMDR